MKFKNAIPKFLYSSIINLVGYKPNVCVYYCSTIRALETRLTEHRGTSSRTGYPLTHPFQSSVRNHCESYGTNVNHIVNV